MSDDRLRIPQDSAYFEAVGLATIAFARLEWDAVWCCERLEPGYIGTIEAVDAKGKKRGKTAGMIADDLVEKFEQVADANLRRRIVSHAREFKAIVKLRNGLIHGKPGTAPNGDQRLFRDGDEWSIQAVNDFADRCVRGSQPLNALLYNELKA